MYWSNAIVIEGASGVGAIISTRKPQSSASFLVVPPNTAIRVLSCTKSGKFLNSELIHVGLKKHKTSYCKSRKSDKSLIAVRKKIPCVQFTPKLLCVCGTSSFNLSDAANKNFSSLNFLIKGDKSAKSFSPTYILRLRYTTYLCR